MTGEFRMAFFSSDVGLPFLSFVSTKTICQKDLDKVGTDRQAGRLKWAS